MPQVSPTTDTRQAVLNAARQGFAEKGFQQSAIYNHFDNKQALLFELLKHHMEALQSSLELTLKTGLDPIDQLRAFARFHTEYHIEFPDDVFIAYMELRSLEPDNRATLIKMRNHYETHLRDIISAGLSSGDFRCQDAAVHTRAIIAMLTGVTVWFNERGRLDRGSVVEYYVTAALQSVGVFSPNNPVNSTARDNNTHV